MNVPIRVRLAFSFSFLFGVLFIGFCAVIYSLLSRHVESQLRDQTLRDGKILLAAFAEDPWETVISDLNKDSGEVHLHARVVNESGRDIFRSEGLSPGDRLPDLPAKALLDQPLWTKAVVGGIPHIVLTQAIKPEGRERHFLQTFKSEEGINRIRGRLLSIMVLLFPPLVLLSFLTGLGFAKRALAPMDIIRQKADAIDSASLSSRLPLSGPRDELRALTETLNGLLNRIENAFNRMKQFTADASHELRTPITALQGALEVALRTERTPEEYRRALHDAHEEARRLGQLAQDLLELARDDDSPTPLEKEETEMGPYLEDIFEKAKTLDPAGKVRMVLGSLSSAKVPIHRGKIRRVVLNLLDNAVAHNRPGGEVVLKGGPLGRHFVVSVKDSGPGIAPENLSRIFERFFREDKSRSRERGGAGLGLAIAKSIARSHGGDLTVQSVLGLGSEFQLCLPLE